MFTLACKDMGVDCPFVAEGATKEEALKASTDHAMSAHGMTAENMTDDMKAKADSMVKETV